MHASRYVTQCAHALTELLLLFSASIILDGGLSVGVVVLGAGVLVLFLLLDCIVVVEFVDLLSTRCTSCSLVLEVASSASCAHPHLRTREVRPIHI